MSFKSLIRIRDKAARVASHHTFGFFEKYLGVHITPAHYYSPIPIVSQLGAETFRKEFEGPGLDWNVPEQQRHLNEIFPRHSQAHSPRQNTGLTLVDSFVLHAMIRHYKPRVMVEIGSGETTRISLDALARNREEGHPFHFYAVEPYPRADLKAERDPDFTLIPSFVQDVDLAVFRDADLLFIDSSHVSKVGSDVNMEILEIVPRLKPGAVIHWHDIPLPTNYWRDWVLDGNKFWNESYMLHAFLLFNREFDVIWASRFMALRFPEELGRAFPYMRPDHRLSSFWIRRRSVSQ